jgi:NADPH2:quinone reductase
MCGRAVAGSRVMRSIVYTQRGEPADVLKIEERPTPSPGPGQVRLKLTLSPVHNHDTATIEGKYGVLPDLPAIAGSEALGIVDAIGEGVSSPRVGQRVVGITKAAWAEYVIMDAKAAVPLPDTIPDTTACQLIAMPLSAMMLIEEYKPGPGEWLAQNAANGAVAKVLAKLAAARGINVLNLVRRDEAVAELASLGIGNAVSTANKDWRKAAKAIVGDGRVATAFDSVAGRASQQLADVLARNGTLVVFGGLSSEPVMIDPGAYIFKGLTTRGFWALTPPPALAAKMPAIIGELVRMAAAGELELPVDETFPLEAISAAMKAHGSGGRAGKIALRP